MDFVDQYGVLFSEDRKTLKKFNSGINVYTVPEGVEILETSSLKNCDSLEVLILPRSLRLVRHGAFSGCKHINRIEFTGTMIEWLNIQWYSQIESSHVVVVNGLLVEELVIPNAISRVLDYAFYYCSSLKRVIFHRGVKEIGKCAFNKTKLSGELCLNEGLMKIGPHAFFNTSITSVNLPNSLVRIHEGAFATCYQLRSFFIGNNDNFIVDKNRAVIQKSFNAGELQQKGWYDDWEVHFLDDKGVKATLVAFASANTVEPYIVPDYVECIEGDTLCYSTLGEFGIIINHELDCSRAFREAQGSVYVLPHHKLHYSGSIPADVLVETFDVNYAFIDEPKVLSSILNNPFRILGVYANASSKEITSNARKIKRFIEVGKTVEFPLDLLNFLPPVNRTQESVDNALSMLSDPKEKFKSSLFWFSRVDDIDGIGLDNLFAGHVEKAIEIFEKKDNWHSSFNNSTLAFLQNRFEDAITIITRSIDSDKYADLLNEICGDVIALSREDASKIIIDTLLKEISLLDCRTLYAQNGCRLLDDEYLDDCLRKRNTDIINDAILVAKNVPNDGKHNLLDVAKNLEHKAWVPLREYALFIGEDNDYCMLADKLANQILQCAIDFYNSSIDRYAVLEALVVAKSALTIARGKIRKERIQHNIDIFEKIANKLPPKAVAADDDALSSIFSEFGNKRGTIEVAWQILSQGAPSIIHIKECLGELYSGTDDYKSMDKYLTTVSTALVNLSLTKLIEAVNDSSSYTGGLIEAAWNIMLCMEQFPMDYEFKAKRFSENKTTLKEIRSKIHIMPLGMLSGYYGSSSWKIDMRTGKDIWLSCSSISDYEYYLQRFPNGKYASAAQDKINKLKIEAEDKLWAEVQLSGEYDEYISQYPLGRYIDEAKIRQEDKIYNDSTTIADFRNYLTLYPNGRYLDNVHEKLTNLIARDNSAWDKCKTKQDYLDYCKGFPYGLHIEEANAVLSKIQKRATILKWFIALEIVAIVILCLYAFCSLTVAKNITIIVIILSIIAGLFTAAIKYGNS